MDEERIKELEAKGFCVGDIQDFLGLTSEELEKIKMSEENKLVPSAKGQAR